jgi:hypothetical protein
LSQTQLNLLATCPRKFQHIYLEQLGVPSTLEQQERQSLGTRFHQLVQQWQLGLPVEPLVQADLQLQRWFTTFVDAAPEILSLGSGSKPTDSISEYQRTLEFHGYLLTVVYDLLILDRDRARILDWKTYPRPQTSRWLLQNWQTRLYPFVLAETSPYQPEQISMVYWFFQSHGDPAGEPQSISVSYTLTQHEQIRQDLTQLLNQLTHWLDRYQAGQAFPQLAPGANPCSSCSFAIRCFGIDAYRRDRVPISQSDPSSSLLPNLEDIQEVPV